MQSVKDGFCRIVGAIIYYALFIVDSIQSILGIQKKKRPLTEDERVILWKVFRNSLNYNAISIVNGKAGILGVSGRAFTMGFTIYLPSNNDAVLVHECVHVWQFQVDGTKYIGNSALNQLDSMLIKRGYDPYSWANWIGAGNSWHTLKSAEAQAQFIQDVFTKGEFIFTDQTIPSDSSPGAFFKEAMLGRNNARIAALSKEQRRRDCARRHCGSYRGAALHRQRFPCPLEALESGRKWPISG